MCFLSLESATIRSQAICGRNPPSQVAFSSSVSYDDIWGPVGGKANDHNGDVKRPPSQIKNT